MSRIAVLLLVLLVGCETATPPLPVIDGNYRRFTVFFAFDSAALTVTADNTLKHAATHVIKHSTDISVVGHTDRAGDSAYNLALSERRAIAVIRRLVEYGVPEATIQIRARGETQPLINTEDGLKEPQNRRVEINF